MSPALGGGFFSTEPPEWSLGIDLLMLTSLHVVCVGFCFVFHIKIFNNI